MDTKYLKQGNYVSLIASLIILAGLVMLEVKGINYALSLPFITLMWIVWFLAIPSFLSYHLAKLEKSWIMDYFAISAIIITFVGLMLATSLKEFLGIEMILVGYTLEPVAGISIYLSTMKVNRVYSSLFFWGAVVFTAGLPLYLFNFGYISVIGDVVKMVGIVGLLSIKGLNRGWI
ncbi:hypothetical protein [Acidianus sp. HS-5]|uniref:hypothetical protein n=1 Tax=Acidianus sp. HS-5 TaxID=2886040 RepID=UPI001F42042A|nr:hypothetical protein [Acidianus sp. HS-5]BDC17311.1 hypothetical protein HS5_02010 [Acidianus sp. HS-5]